MKHSKTQGRAKTRSISKRKAISSRKKSNGRLQELRLSPYQQPRSPLQNQAFQRGKIPYFSLLGANIYFLSAAPAPPRRSTAEVSLLQAPHFSIFPRAVHSRKV